jgi:hypothetical protein
MRLTLRTLSCTRSQLPPTALPLQLYMRTSTGALWWQRGAGTVRQSAPGLPRHSRHVTLGRHKLG